MPFVPTSAVVPVRVSTETPEGLLLSYGRNHPPMIVTQWGDRAHVVHLEGSHAFTHFGVQAGVSIRGTVITGLEFVIDPASKYDSVQEHDPLGALVLRDGEMFIVAQRAGDTFGDPQQVPVSGDVQAVTEHEAVGFTRWGIRIKDGGAFTMLWSTPDEDQAQPA